ncbi:hypothetical protein ATY41_12130 [Leifsonia xyli subsp. xyli]|uniref:ABC transporter domain-containing protein n=1 Tax=Leifsonia xyli subsp. xyli TaxID=59736 RepID=A0A1E2SJ08_LEIXY|nr:hypothetical protein ATY41_12130 [Leifsonia xyli subsp. xyli]
MSESIAVEAKNVFKVFGRKPGEALRRPREGTEVTALGTAAVIDASLAVRRGEIFVVMGLSGSGKSTLIRLLNGLLEPTAGEVAVMGATITGLTGKRLREVRQRHISMCLPALRPAAAPYRARQHRLRPRQGRARRRPP